MKLSSILMVLIALLALAAGWAGAVRPEDGLPTGPYTWLWACTSTGLGRSISASASKPGVCDMPASPSVPGRGT